MSTPTKNLVHSDFDIYRYLRCPISHQKINLFNNSLVTEDNSHKYKISPEGIPLFAEEELTESAKIQQSHYDKIASEYVRNLGFPHTQEYQGYLDRVLKDSITDSSLKIVGEICCGAGEVGRLFEDKVESVIGFDVSLNMLRTARQNLDDSRFIFIQGDATNLPMDDESLDNIIMLGGIHHVGDRQKLFSEVFRLLKPGGKFYFREPVSDFFLWKAIRAIIYRFSPTLDHETERPLLYDETVPILEEVGFNMLQWKTFGFIGFCLFMNSDVLVFNRLFRFLPGIRMITRATAAFDHFFTALPSLSRRGLIVVGVAQKPD